ncbi:MAG: hypothetical protein ACE5DI_02865 [Candidatus Micrarchaeia archaeon]
MSDEKFPYPDAIAHIGILAEDAGLVDKLVDADEHPSFEDGMVSLSFFGIPDEIVYGFAFASLVYVLFTIGFF